MREHRYDVFFPHSPERLWSLMQDYERWSDYAPMVIRVEVCIRETRTATVGRGG